MRRSTAFLFGGGMAAVGLCAVAAASAPSPDPGQSLGFVVTNLSPAFYKGEEAADCPQGRSHTVREAFLATQTAAEQARLMKPENAEELERKYKVDYVYGQGMRGKDICTNSETFDDTPGRELQKPLGSRIAYGLDLDGAAPGSTAPGVCAHEPFLGPGGETGVDNQYFRAIGCNTFWRGEGAGVGDEINNHRKKWSDTPALVILRGVDDWTNDAQVELEIAASPDRAATDPTGRILAGGSFSVRPDGRYRTTFAAKIRNGVLTTGARDLVLPINWVGSSGGEYILKRARFELRRQANGDLAGVGGAYRPIDNALAIHHVGGPGNASVAGVECASIRKTMRLLADGDPDPRTGQCTTLSMGIDFAAAPAFVFERGGLIAGPPGSARLAAAK